MTFFATFNFQTPSQSTSNCFCKLRRQQPKTTERNDVRFIVTIGTVRSRPALKFHALVAPFGVLTGATHARLSEIVSFYCTNGHFACFPSLCNFPFAPGIHVLSVRASIGPKLGQSGLFRSTELCFWQKFVVFCEFVPRNIHGGLEILWFLVKKFDLT